MKQYKQMQPAVFEKKEELLPVCSESGFNGEPKVIKGPLGESVRSVTWLANNVLATAGDDCATTLHDLTTEKTSVTAPHSSRVWSVATTSDGSLSASGGKDGAIVLFNAVKGVLSTVQGHVGEINCVAFSNTGRFLASASDDHTVVVWDVSQPAAPVQASVLQGHTGWVRACAWSPDGRLLATGGADRTLRLWTIDAAGAGVDCHVVEHSHSLSLRGLAFSPGWAPAGGLLATACFDNVVRLFALHVDAAGRVQQAHFKQSLFGHPSGVWTVCWSPDGTLLASGGAQPAPHTLSPCRRLYLLREGAGGAGPAESAARRARQASTTLSGCGVSRATARSSAARPRPDTPARSAAWRSRRTEGASRPRPATAPRGCGGFARPPRASPGDSRPAAPPGPRARRGGWLPEVAPVRRVSSRSLASVVGPTAPVVNPWLRLEALQSAMPTPHLPRLHYSLHTKTHPRPPPAPPRPAIPAPAPGRLSLHAAEKNRRHGEEKRPGQQPHACAATHAYAGLVLHQHLQPPRPARFRRAEQGSCRSE
jgi:hypothetical protein